MLTIDNLSEALESLEQFDEYYVQKFEGKYGVTIRTITGHAKAIGDDLPEAIAECVKRAE